MNVSATRLAQVPAQGNVARRGLDVTVSDTGVHTRPASPAPAAAVAVPVVATPVVEPTSTAELATSLSVGEKAALTERFAALPRNGVTGSGVYDPRGRTPTMPTATQQGHLLDITG